VIVNAQEQLWQAFYQLDNGTLLEIELSVMNESKFVIIGGGMAAGYAVKQFVGLDLKSGRVGDPARRYSPAL